MTNNSEPIEKQEKNVVIDYFAEKEQQIKPDTIEAFGIELISRYGDSSEIIEMINFSEKLAVKKCAHYVKQLFYDSKATICSIEVDETVRENDPVGMEIFKTAKETLSQFVLFGKQNGLGYDE